MKPLFRSFLTGAFLFMISGVSAQEVAREPIPYQSPAVINMGELAAWELLHPYKHDFRDFEKDEEEHKGIPRKHTIGDDATQTIIELPESGLRVQSPPPVASFNGLLDNGSTIPPDVHGAAGDNHLMEVLNSQFRTFTKTGSTVTTINIWTFFGFSSSNFYTDPRVAYDPYNDRWLATICADVPGGNNGIYLSVSQTSDPTGAWYVYNVDATGNGTSIYDYPSLGFNKDYIAVTGNVFNGSGFFQHVKTLVFDKASLYSGSAGTVSSFTDGTIFTLQPAVTYDNSVSTLYMVAEWDNSQSNFGYVKLFKITGPPNAPVYTAGSTVGVNQTWSTNGKDAPQLGITNKIETGDTRMQNAVYSDGYLYTCHTVFLPTNTSNRAAAQWWQINVSNNTVTNFGRVEDPAAVNFYYYPSITVNTNGDVLMGYSTSSANIYASAAYSFRTANDAANTLQDPYTYKAGLNTYYKTFGGGINRWGDYSAAVVDPVDNSIWTLQEFANSTKNNWGTNWANIPASNVLVCIIPSGLATTNITSTTADISWNVVSGATNYNIRYKPTASGTWSDTSTTGNSLTLSSLTSSTQHEFQVQAECANGGVSNFSASGLFTTSASVCTDAYESNNTKGKAKAITPGVSIQALIHTSTDKDWFKFSNTVSTPNVRIVMSALPADYDMKFFNPSDVKVSSSENSGLNDEEILYNTSTVGLYKVQIYGFGGANNPTVCYTLTAYLSATPYKLGDGDDVETPELSNLLNLYPNPSDGMVVADYNSLTPGKAQWMVYDLLGKMVYQESTQVNEGVNSMHLNLNHLANGVYFLKVSNGTETETRKFEIRH